MGAGAARKPRFWAVVPAAGGGTRMGQSRPKQYLLLRDRTLLEWSLAPFLAAGWIDGVVVVLAAQDQEFAKLPLARHPKIVTAIGGGQRAQSVLAGVERIRERAGAEVFALVHDAARPCVLSSDLERLRDEAADRHGGLLAVPMADTVKRAQQGRVAATADRSVLWRAQTPQLFHVEQLREALQTCARRGIEVTDEASAIEHLGGHPKLVRGREGNIKVTFPEDLRLAEFWLDQQKRL